MLLWAVYVILALVAIRVLSRVWSGNNAGYPPWPRFVGGLKGARGRGRSGPAAH